MDSVEAVWFRNPRTGDVHKVLHPDTIARCRREGHIEVPDPTTLPVAESPEAPDTATSSDTTAVPAPDPDAQAALEAAHLAAIQERNAAAREAFGIAAAPAHVEAKPVKRVAPRPGVSRPHQSKGA